MPPLSLTQSKYAFATFPIVVKSTPGISMAMPPSLIGAPVAFFPVPAPHLLTVAPAAAEPTFAVDLELAAVASATVASSATGRATAKVILRSIIPRPPSSDVNPHVRVLDGHLAARASGMPRR